MGTLCPPVRSRFLHARQQPRWRDGIEFKCDLPEREIVSQGSLNEWLVKVIMLLWWVRQGWNLKEWQIQHGSSAWGMPLHVYNIIIPGGLGLRKKKVFPYLWKKIKLSITRSAGINLRHWAQLECVPSLDTVQAGKKKKIKTKWELENPKRYRRKEKNLRVELAI